MAKAKRASTSGDVAKGMDQKGLRDPDWERNMWWEDNSDGDPAKWRPNTGKGWNQNKLMPIAPDPVTGELTVIEVEPIRGAWPRNINLDPSGQWLLAAGADSNTVSVHQVDQETGRLTFQRKGIVNVPSPICIVFVGL